MADRQVCGGRRKKQEQDRHAPRPPSWRALSALFSYTLSCRKKVVVSLCRRMYSRIMRKGRLQVLRGNPNKNYISYMLIQRMQICGNPQLTRDPKGLPTISSWWNAPCRHCQMVLAFMRSNPIGSRPSKKTTMSPTRIKGEDDVSSACIEKNETKRCRSCLHTCLRARIRVLSRMRLYVRCLRH